MDLNDYRKQIDEIDSQLLDLFERRMELAKDIADYKKQNNLPVDYKIEFVKEVETYYG